MRNRNAAHDGESLNRAAQSPQPASAAGRYQITAATLGPGDTAAVITAGSRAAELANGRWQRLPALPPATAAIAPGADGTIEALAVRRATLTVWHLAGEHGSWARKQVITVPILYGSSG